MTDPNKDNDNLIWFLSERAKELNCLYRIEELLNRPDDPLDKIGRGIIEAIPPGWQYPELCVARLILDGQTWQSPLFQETAWVQTADIRIQDQKAGTLGVYYLREMPNADDGPFLKEESKLLGTIADRLGHYLLYARTRQAVQDYQAARRDLAGHETEGWRAVLSFLKRTNKNLFIGISRRMLNVLCWSGVGEAERYLQKPGPGQRAREEAFSDEENRPDQNNGLSLTEESGDEIFRLAARHFSDGQIWSHIQQWIQEDRLGFLIQIINRNLPLADIVDAWRRYHHIAAEGIELPPASKRGVLVSLLSRFLSDRAEDINVARKYVDIEDFHDIMDHIVYSPDSLGRLGGKSAGLFLAERIIADSAAGNPRLGAVKVPKTWYIASDCLFDFLRINNLTEVVEQKYKDINQVRLEYPHLVQIFKNARFPKEIIQGLSMALDDFQDRPLIVRSSSLLEDRMGASFSGKYKSLFLANQGDKPDRLEALMEAVAEVYASTYAPDPIGYRAERGLLDANEEMGILIQEVVGFRAGDYFLPAFAGVAFSRNEFRWSPRIQREDGLLRMVLGLGTRAVDRTSDDYPALVAPGRPDLRVNVSPEEIVRYAPRKADVINLKTQNFETVEIRDLLKATGARIPGIEKLVSIYDDEHLRRPLSPNLDFADGNLVVTFEGLLADDSFMPVLRDVLKLLEDRLGWPVDLEFASDGKDFFLLQCRPQSCGEGGGPSPIPKNVPADRLLFSGRRYVSNGRVPELTHIVYVDPRRYDELTRTSSLLAVGRAVGKLNRLLPRRRFLLMGPGRWGSRGDLKLGVKVTYSDISNTAVLVEIARKKGNEVPDLSFGTHFFQDLVESEIRYLPLYLDDPETVFNAGFFDGARNILPEILPEFVSLAEVVRVIDVPQAAPGFHLKVLMNADINQAVGLLERPAPEPPSPHVARTEPDRPAENHWAWRLRMAELIASRMDPDRFGVQGAYVFGSVKNATAGPQSDIDLLIHHRGTRKQRADLQTWLEGWSLSLAELNFQKTGLPSDGLLDVHIVTDADIARKTSYAVKIGAVTDAARPLPLMKKPGR